MFRLELMKKRHTTWTFNIQIKVRVAFITYIISLKFMKYDLFFYKFRFNILI